MSSYPTAAASLSAELAQSLRVLEDVGVPD
jgi:hypothetical protein